MNKLREFVTSAAGEITMIIKEENEHSLRTFWPRHWARCAISFNFHNGLGWWTLEVTRRSQASCSLSL